MIVVRRARPREHSRRQTDMDDMYRSLLAGHSGVGSGSRRAWRPPVEVFESSDALEIVAEIAGMRREDIDVVIEGDVLTLRGNRHDSTSCDHRTYHEARIAYGAFAADIHIPFAVEAESASASYENGFLRITLPRAKGRTIIPTRAGSADDAPNEEKDA
jgi:HSP20 family protein